MKTRPEPGSKIRLTSAFLRSTGQSRRDAEGGRTWTVLACSCGLCAGGNFACTDQEHDPAYRASTWGDLPEDQRPRYRHLAVDNVEVIGRAEPEPRAEIAWWSKVIPTVPYPGVCFPAGTRAQPSNAHCLAYAVVVLRGEVFWRWCGYLWASSYAHGSELAEALGTGGLLPQYPTGDPDSCASADRLLAAAEEAGWIRRVFRGEDAAATPTPEQSHMGANGVFGRRVRSQRCPRLFGWEPIRESPLRAWLGFEGSSSEGGA